MESERLFKWRVRIIANEKVKTENERLYKWNGKLFNGKVIKLRNESERLYE